MSSASYPDRPVLSLRLGITGKRDLDKCQVDRLQQQLNEVLSAVRGHMERLAKQDIRLLSAYAHQAGETPSPLLRFISPLAAGADRLAAREALAEGYQLHVPMPFPRADYETDFQTPEDLAEFRELFALSGENWLAIDGSHGPPPHMADRAYEAVGRYVVKHCDVLIAIWDENAGGGRGGTGDIVHFAAHCGVPVWWLHAKEDRPPAWIADIQDLRHPNPQPANSALEAYLDNNILPPEPYRRSGQGATGWLARLGQPTHVSPEIRHFEERQLKRRWPWLAYGKMLRFASGKQMAYAELIQPSDIVAQYWFDRYQPADARANEYTARYRSSYTWIFLFGILSVLFGSLGSILGLTSANSAPLRLLVHSGSIVCAILEVGALFFIFLLVVVATRRDWHERSIEYRLLAELCRKQQMLAPLGGALPITAVRDMSTTDQGGDHGAWITWLFAAEQRAAPFPQGDLASAVRGAPRTAILEELIALQHRYHEQRGEITEAAGSRLAQLGELFFIIVLVCLGAKLVLGDALEMPSWAEPFGLLATVLPGFSAAFVGLRAYAELELLAEQSRHMVANLSRAKRRLESLELDKPRPLASQDLAAEAATVATLMLQDLDGWARLFRVKGMEAS